MKRLLSPILTLLAATAIVWPVLSQTGDPEPRLPNGRSQYDAILQEDYQKNLQDLNRMVKLTEEVKIDLEKNDRFVLSIDSLKKLREVEDLSKKVRGRMKRR
jgi:hypothetical protein